MEICETSGLPIPMVPHLHQRNVYIKRKLGEWRAQKCNTMFGADTVLTSAGPQTTLFHGVSIGTRTEICESSGLPIPMVPPLRQSNGYIKRKLGEWRAQKCNAIVGVHTVLNSTGPQTTPFQGGQHRAKNGSMPNFGPTNPHGTAFAPKQWLHQKEAR